MSPAENEEGVRPVAVNRKARHDFFVLETVEAGMELKGSEVKSMREGAVNLKEGFARLDRGQLFLEGVHVSAYEYANRQAPDPVRPRRLLLHRREIRRLAGRIQQERLTLVPLRVYFKKGWAKIELGLAKGKKFRDKREALRKAETRRALERARRK